ncbi:hypothetical protein G3480_25260 [Thiorhodococcus mannitoliphagus]|uniref:Uncharacterized protein n=1 Tax=Thiorhodococcus mannitoliphagus TaxID=329406 RepID=A0A6P1DZ88_9GAMM|nr:hypothetical protein [Thiorhodococcus mannitoliphagus]
MTNKKPINLLLAKITIIFCACLISGCGNDNLEEIDKVTSQLESCNQDLRSTMEQIARYETQLDFDKKTLQQAYEKEFRKDIKNEVISSSIPYFFALAAIMILLLISIFFYFQNNLNKENAKRQAEFNKKETELASKQAKLDSDYADIENKKAEALKDIYVHDEYGKKLGEAISFLKHELGKDIDTAL